MNDLRIIKIDQEHLNFLISYIKSSLLNYKHKSHIEDTLREVLDVLELENDTGDLK